MTAITTAAPAETGYLPAGAGGVDRAIRISTAIAVLAVAGVAAYESYWHAYAVIWAHGESGVTARLEPATIDGLVYASSMVITTGAGQAATAAGRGAGAGRVEALRAGEHGRTAGVRRNSSAARLRHLRARGPG